MAVNPSEIRPFEICSIRPPTENYSLTFRLTRNCYWNKCKFCPAYKFGFRFSKRSLEDVLRDVRRARMIDEALAERGYHYHELPGLIEEIRTAGGGSRSEEDDYPSPEIPEDLDPRLSWFLSWFKEKPGLPDSFSHIISWRVGGGKTCFLGDADSLVLKPEFLGGVLREIGEHFPSIERFTVYGRTRSAARVRSSEDLEAFAEAGLHRVHFGIESGSDAVLDFVQKGETRQDHIEGCIKTRESGLSCSAYVMPGLGGVRWSEEHAHETADVISRAEPDYVRIRSLVIFPQTPLEEARKSGEFEEADDEQVVREIRTMIGEINAQTVIVSDSAANLLSVNGNLPEDRRRMLDEIDRYLDRSPREKLEFNLKSRLNSFISQYGGLSGDILELFRPYVRGDHADFSAIPEEEIRGMTDYVKGKLMP